MIKKIMALCLIFVLLLTAVPFTVSAQESKLPSFITAEDTGLFVHGSEAETANEAWQLWQSEIEEVKLDENDENKYRLDEINITKKYFFLPSCVKGNSVEIYNGFTTAVTVNGVTIPAKTTGTVTFEEDIPYAVSVNGTSYTLVFMKSTAEGSMYINNPDADGNDTELLEYLSPDKSLSAKATSAIIDADGTVQNPTIKKIKGRGNTTWKKAKKPFNVTFDDKVTIAGMGGGKKYSLLANYQDSSLMRNRILYDLADAVGVPYSSDSRFVDLYMNGVYYGSYQICQKIEVGKNDVVNDIDDEAYLNADGTVAEDFPFLMEIDPSASGEDYTTSASGNSLTIKAPELSSGDTGYEEVKSYAAEKFTELYNAIQVNASLEDLEKIMDVESFTKLYLINELGKNWDSGVSSVYMVYKQDDEGNWKFFASPVWDYDNSLGNANGVASELNSMGVKDYTKPTGWWCGYKGYGSNIMKKIARCQSIVKKSAEIWFADFVPALEAFSSKNVDHPEFYNRNTYYDLLKGSAKCNYTRGWMLKTGDWIADQNTLATNSYNYETNKLTTGKTKTYPETFEGKFNYTCDWLVTRGNWISSQLYSKFVDKTYSAGDINADGEVNIIDATMIQMSLVGYALTDNQVTAGDVNGDGICTVKDVTCLQKKLAGID